MSVNFIDWHLESMSKVPIFDLLNHVQAGGKGLNCDHGVIGFDLVTVMQM